MSHDQNSQLGVSEELPSLQVGVDLLFRGDCISIKIDQEMQTSEKLSAQKTDAGNFIDNDKLLLSTNLLTTFRGSYSICKIANWFVYISKIS